MRRTLVFFGLALLSGCGLALDLEPPDDAGVGGFDAAPRDGGMGGADGAPGACRGPADCPDDDDPCNGSTYCDLRTGRCVVEPAPSCDDGDACTVDSCEAGACVNQPVVCPDDGVACTEEVCDAETGECVSVERDDFCPTSSLACVTSECDETEGCVDVDLCEATGGMCNSDANACVYADCEVSCAPIGPCSDGAYCDGSVCIQVLRAPGSPCEMTACGGGQCDASGACVDFTYVDCDDGNPCTLDSCDSSSGCLNPPRADGTTCATDTNLCTTQQCIDGMCSAPTTIGCMDDGNPCTRNTCDPSTGGCSPSNIADGATCGLNATCRVGVCNCEAGFADCDGDGDCECMGICGAVTGGGVAACTMALACPTCPSGQTCCPCTGSCIGDSAACLDTGGRPCPIATTPPGGL